MTFISTTSPSYAGESVSPLLTSFTDHKFLLLAILNCLQSRMPQRKGPRLKQFGGLDSHRLLSNNLSERENTPCIVLRDSKVNDSPSVASLALDCVNLNLQMLTDWMQKAVPASRSPTADILHLAMASTLPGIPNLFLSVDGSGESFSHSWQDGEWTRCLDNSLLLHSIHYANLVGTSIAIDANRNGISSFHVPRGSALELNSYRKGSDINVCGFNDLAVVYDHIAVHAAMAEFRTHRESKVKRGLSRPSFDECQTSY